MSSIQARIDAFCADYDLEIPILMAPMAGACPPELAIAVARAGGMGACGALLMKADAIKSWANTVRQQTNGAFQINTWIPDPAPARDPKAEAAMAEFLGGWGPELDSPMPDVSMIDFDAQCAAMLDASPHVISSIMGLYPDAFIAEMKARRIKWFCTVTTVAEAEAAADAGADVIIAQGMEAGGHRGAFEASKADNAVGLFSLLPAVVDAVDLPVVATGGIVDGRSIAAALTLGASAVQIGTGLLRTPEAGIATAWADAIGSANPEDTSPTRGFSGRLGRAIQSEYVKALDAADAPAPLPYPQQRQFTQAMRDAAAKENDITRIQAWAGQSSKRAQAMPATELVRAIWNDALSYLNA